MWCCFDICCFVSKPTTLAFTGHHPHLASLFRHFQIRQDLPTEVSVGKDASGEFKTAKLKAYPGPLCRAMASVLQQWMGHLHCDDVDHVPNESMRLFERFEQYHDAAMGPDFVPPSNPLISFA